MINTYFILINCKNLSKYPHDNQLCVVDASNEYILRTSNFRNDWNCNQLLLDIITPHKPVVPSTASV